MGETVASNSALQVSVSFGRFETDSLSWEKWSAFSPNKYLEEVEKCATPGSVAQKKAYFEAHYKNIAARKAELLVEDKQAENNNAEFDPGCNTLGTHAEIDLTNTQGFDEGLKQETDSSGEIVRTHKEEDVAVSRDYRSTSVGGENEELESGSHCSQIGKPEEAVCVEQEDSPGIEAEDVKAVSNNVDNENGKALEVEAEDVKLDQPKVSKKVTLVNKESNAAKMKKKSVLPTSKASQISMTRSSRPAATPTKTLAFASSTKRGNSPSLSGKKITSIGENRKVPNRSLHMSLSLGPSKLAPAPAPHTTSRKSFIVEKMGDKDMVKRAFKTFQNNFVQPKTSVVDKSVVKRQVPPRGTEPRVPTSMISRKENGRSTKVGGMDKRNGNAVRTTLGPKSDIRAEKGNESSRQIEEKSNAKEVERTRLQLKSKDEKLQHNFKATPLPAFYLGQTVSKKHPVKGVLRLRSSGSHLRGVRKTEEVKYTTGAS